MEIEFRAPHAVDATPARWRGDAGPSPLDRHTGSDVLDIDPTSVKALFRRGKCQLACDKWDAAKESFRKVLELDEGNVEARRGLQSVRLKQQQQKEKEKKLYAGKKLFDGKARPAKALPPPPPEAPRCAEASGEPCCPPAAEQ